MESNLIVHGPTQNPCLQRACGTDLCSRSGGTVALCTAQQDKVHVVDLTLGERGESEDFWKGKGNKSIEEAKKIRRAEAEEAANVLLFQGDIFNTNLLDYLLPCSNLLRRQVNSDKFTIWEVESHRDQITPLGTS